MKIHNTVLIFSSGLFFCTQVDAASMPEHKKRIMSPARVYKQKHFLLNKRLSDVAIDYWMTPSEKLTAMQNLLTRGANVNYTNYMKWQPLRSLLATKHDATCIQLLVNAKAQLSTTDGYYYLDNAMLLKQHDAVRILLDAKASPTNCDLYTVSGYASHAPNDLLPALIPYIPGGEESRMCMSKLQREKPYMYDTLLNHGIVPDAASNTPWQQEACAKLIIAVPVQALVQLVENYLYGDAKA